MKARPFIFRTLDWQTTVQEAVGLLSQEAANFDSLVIAELDLVRILLESPDVKGQLDEIHTINGNSQQRDYAQTAQMASQSFGGSV